MRILLRGLPLAALGVAVASAASQVSPPTPQPFDSLALSLSKGELAQDKSAEYFEASVRPVLAASCYECHTDQRMGGLRVDSRDALLKGGRTGPAIVPGDPDKSLMIQALRQTGTLKMPKGGHLKPEEIDALAAWIKAGADWPSFAASVNSV